MKHYYSILIILLLPLLAILCYATVDEPVSTEITRVNISKFLAQNDTIEAEAIDAADSTAVDTVPQRILLFGDSMVEGLGLRLAEYAAYNGHDLTFVTWVSSTTVAWNSDTLRHYLREANPTYVMITLGGNEQTNRNEEIVTRNIKEILSIIGDIPYVWICTPAWDKDAPFNAVPERVCGKRRFFDSRTLTLDRVGDHRHPTYDAAAIWMDSVAVWMQSTEREHPIVMKCPPKGTEKKCVKYYLKPAPGYGKHFIVTRTQYFGTNGAAQTTTIQPAPAPVTAPMPINPRKNPKDRRNRTVPSADEATPAATGPAEESTPAAVHHVPVTTAPAEPSATESH